MTIEDIRKLIDKDESITLELKKTTGELKDAMHTACAFLNTDGGWLIFGVTPTSRRMVGQDVNDDTQREISQALSGLEPAVEVKINYFDVPEGNGKKVIAIHFDAFVWGSEPYTYDGNTTVWRAQPSRCHGSCSRSASVPTIPTSMHGSVDSLTG